MRQIAEIQTDLSLDHGFNYNKDFRSRTDMFIQNKQKLIQFSSFNKSEAINDIKFTNHIQSVRFISSSLASASAASAPDVAFVLRERPKSSRDVRCERTTLLAPAAALTGAWFALQRVAG